MRISRDEWQWRDDEVMLGIISRDILFLIPIVSDALYCLCIGLSISRFLFSRAAGACYRVCDVRWSVFVFSSLVVAEWCSSGGAFHPSAGVATTSVHTTVIWTVCTVYSVHSVQYTGWSPPCCPAARPAASRRARPHTSPSLRVGLRWAGLGWALRTSKPYLTSSLSRALPPQHTDMLMFFVTVNCD